MKRALSRALSGTAVAALMLSPIGLTSCGNAPNSSAGSGSDQAPAPQGDTVVNNYEIQIGAPIGFDEKVLKTIKGVVGVPLKPFKETQDSRVDKAVLTALTDDNTAQSNAGGDPMDPDGADAGAGGAQPPVADSNSQASATATNPNQQLAQELGVAGPAPVLGVQVKVAGDELGSDLGTRYVEALRKKLPKGYLPFGIELQGGDGRVIAIVKSDDPYKMVRIAGTTGSVTNDAIIQQLKTWNSKYPLHVVFADADNVVALLDKVPPDAEQLAREVQQFAPGDGAAGVKDFLQDIRENRQIFLWWD